MAMAQMMQRRSGSAGVHHCIYAMMNLKQFHFANKFANKFTNMVGSA